jgi:hypothetical protein
MKWDSQIGVLHATPQQCVFSSKKTALCSMPYALCPLPMLSALCPLLSA